MKILVQKFGGTSVATQDSRNRVVEKIKEALPLYDGVVVVVSAMGRVGDPYATDSLLGLVDSKNSYLTDREKDLLMSCGEIISTVVMSDLLKKAGIDAIAMTGGEAGIMTDEKHLNAEILSVNPTPLFNLMKDHVVPVVAGFQGRSKEGQMTTIGRGGSDTTAALLGEAVGAERIEIFTDVEGIMTADPRVCKMARMINTISYNEVFQMADSGAKVIHPRAVEIAGRAGIPMVIKNTFSSGTGTTIMSNYLINKGYDVEDQIITGIAHRKGRVQCFVEGEVDDIGFFSELARKGISIDLINIFPERRVFTIDEEKKTVLVDILSEYGAPFYLIDGCCKVTVIGERMTGVPGVMAKIIQCLNTAGVKILQTSDSLTTIACLISESSLEKAVNALHHGFLVDK